MIYFAVDIETLGLNCETDSILEVAIVCDTGSGHPRGLPTFRRFIYPNGTLRAAPEALQMHMESGFLGVYLRALEQDQSFVQSHAEFCYEEDLGEQAAIWMNDILRNLPLLNDEGSPIDLHPVLAGKNLASFDLPFLNRKADFSNYTRHHHRILDPGGMFADRHDTCPPNLETCLKRAGADNTAVVHRAWDDCLAVIQCVRNHLNRSPRGT